MRGEHISELINHRAEEEMGSQRRRQSSAEDVNDSSAIQPKWICEKIQASRRSADHFTF